MKKNLDSILMEAKKLGGKAREIHEVLEGLEPFDQALVMATVLGSLVASQQGCVPEARNAAVRIMDHRINFLKKMDDDEDEKPTAANHLEHNGRKIETYNF
jgi:hypothetical protein